MSQDPFLAIPPGAAGHFKLYFYAAILRVIDRCGGNKRKAAKLLGLGVTSLYRKLGAPAGAPDDARQP